jgi:hypothetical protein
MFIPDPNFLHPGSRTKRFPDPHPHQIISDFNPKKCFYKLSENDPESSSRIPDLDFLPIPDPGVKKAPDPGSAILTKSLTDIHVCFRYSIKDDADGGSACFGGVSPRKPRPYNFPESQINLKVQIVTKN